MEDEKVANMMPKLGSDKQKLKVVTDGLFYNTKIYLNDMEIKRVIKFEFIVDPNINNPLVKIRLDLVPEEIEIDGYGIFDFVKSKKFTNGTPALLFCAEHGPQRIKETTFYVDPKYAKMPCGCNFNINNEDENKNNWDRNF